MEETEMAKDACPKCDHAMDLGRISVTGEGGDIGYVSDKQKGMFANVTKVQAGRACPNCGYVEFYLKPEELKAKLK